MNNMETVLTGRTMAEHFIGTIHCKHIRYIFSFHSPITNIITTLEKIEAKKKWIKGHRMQTLSQFGSNASSLCHIMCLRS